jgi:hypothetical protein
MLVYGMVSEHIVVGGSSLLWSWNAHIEYVSNKKMASGDQGSSLCCYVGAAEFPVRIPVLAQWTPQRDTKVAEAVLFAPPRQQPTTSNTHHCHHVSIIGRKRMQNAPRLLGCYLQPYFLLETRKDEGNAAASR